MSITVADFSFNQQAVVERKNEIVAKLVMGVRGGLRKNKVRLFFNHAQIICKENDLYYIKSNGEVYACKKLVIATGSKVFIPQIDGLQTALDSGFVLTSKEILDITEIPKSLIVVGGGIIGLEMASYFASVGSSVTVIEASSKICGNLDNEVSTLLAKNLAKNGVMFHLNAKVAAFSEKSVLCEVNGEEVSFTCDKVLLSVGRVANVNDFGLENLLIKFDSRGIAVNENMQTTDNSVYAIGDVNGRVMLAHTAYREAEVCFNHIINNNDRLDYENIPSVIYTSPECAWVGLSEEKANCSNCNYTVKKLPMTYSGRFVAENSSAEGLCKIIIDNKNNTIIGASILADGASELILAVSNLILTQFPIDKINSLIFPHPTVAEIIKDVLNS